MTTSFFSFNAGEPLKSTGKVPITLFMQEQLPYTLHPYHSISPGPNPPRLLTAYIECPMRSKLKYEVDKRSGLLRVDRILHSSVHYPANYGFIPQTYCGDHDPLDILVLGQEATAPGCMITAKTIGGMIMKDQGEEDFKVIAVHHGDPIYNPYDDVSLLPRHVLLEIEHFFSIYKALEPGKKAPELGGFVSGEKTLAVVNQAIEDYKRQRRDILPENLSWNPPSHL